MTLNCLIFVNRNILQSPTDINISTVITGLTTCIVFEKWMVANRLIAFSLKSISFQL